MTPKAFTDINRSTFYTYYLDVYDLLKQLENEIVELTQNEISAVINKADDVSMENAVKTITKLLNERNSILILLLAKGSDKFSDNIFKTIKSALLSRNEKIPKDKLILMEYCFRYHMSATAALITSWNKDNKGLSLEEVLEMVAIVSALRYN